MLCYGPRLGFMLGRGPFSALLHIIADGQDYDNVGGGGGCFVGSGSVSLAMCAGNCLRTLCARFAFFLEFMHANRSLFFYLHFVVLETTVAFFFFSACKRFFYKGTSALAFPTELLFKHRFLKVNPLHESYIL